MSTGVSDHQRNKGQGNSQGKAYNPRIPNKDHHGGEHEDLDSWRGQQHHQGYASSMAATSDQHYINSNHYYGSFQYPTNFVNSDGPWSNGGENMAFMSGGYSGMHDQSTGPYNIDAMFGGNGAFGNFGQPGYGYSFHGKGDYSTWGQPQPMKHYDDYYRNEGMYGDERGMKMVEQGMGGLNINDKDHGGLKDLKEMMMQQSGGNQKKSSWASIAAQPAKPQTERLKKKPGMPPPPIIPSAWENKNGSVPKAPPIAAPIQAPTNAWERKVPPPPPSGLPPPPLNSQPIPPPPNPGMNRGGGYQSHSHGPQLGYMPPHNQGNHSQHHPPPPPLIQQQQSHQQHSQHAQNSNSNHHNSGPSSQQQHQQHHHQQQQQQHHQQQQQQQQQPQQQQLSPAQPKYPDELKIKNEYNPTHFDLTAEGARFFVIKSYSEDDIHRSIKYEIWCSTEHGNKRLDQAMREREGKGPVFLFFSVNSSGHFCGMAQMTTPVDYEASVSVWCQDKWKGQFKVKWIYVKDVPNSALRHIKLENNEDKPVTNSRDTQEVPFEKGKQVLKILHTFHHTTSIFDDFIHYEKRQEEEDQRRSQPIPPINNNHEVARNENHHRGGGRGGGGGSHFHHASGDRGSFHHGSDRGGGRGDGGGRDRDFNSRDLRDHRDRDRGDRDGPRDRDGPPPQRNDRSDFGRGDRGDHFFNPRNGRGGRGHPPRN